MTTSSQWHEEHERLVVFVDQHRADFIEDDEDDAEESEQKMAIVREWLTAIPEAGNLATRNGDGKGKGDMRRPPTASYAQTRDAGKANSALVRLSSSKRRTSASSQLQHNRRQPLRSLASLVRRGGRTKQVVLEQTGGQQVQQKQEEQQQPQQEQQQQQQQMYNQAARPMNSSAPRWLAAVQSTKKSNNKLKQGNRPRSRSVEVASSTPASGGSPGGSSPRHRVAQWGSSSNLLATHSSGGSASLETLRAESRNSAAQASPRYQRVTTAKPLQPRQQDVRKPELTNREINSAAGDRKVTTIKRHVVAQVPQQSENEIELAQEPPNEQPVEPTQESVWQQIDFSMLHQIGQRRPKTAFETPAGTDESVNIVSTNSASPRPAKPTIKATKPQARRAAAATARFDTAPTQTAGSSPTAATYYSSKRRQLFQTASTQAEPETAVGYFIERERASTARQSRARATGQKVTGNNSSSSRGEDQRHLNSSERLGSVGEENSSPQASTARSHQVFQLQPTPSHHSLHSGVAGNGVRSAAEKKPVSYGYNWLQEFNKMSTTEAEIERRVKNGGKLRNSASQTTRFKLPFDLRELEKMDPKDYLKEYTVVSSRRMYLYQKVFQKYRNSSSNAVEVKDLSKCISDIIVGGISEEKLEEMMDLTGISTLDPKELDSKLFYAFCAVVERQTTGKSLPDDPSELMECHKQRLESADFIGLNYKFKGVNLSEEMARLLKAL